MPKHPEEVVEGILAESWRLFKEVSVSATDFLTGGFGASKASPSRLRRGVWSIGSRYVTPHIQTNLECRLDNGHLECYAKLKYCFSFFWMFPVVISEFSERREAKGTSLHS